MKKTSKVAATTKNSTEEINVSITRVNAINFSKTTYSSTITMSGSSLLIYGIEAIDFNRELIYVSNYYLQWLLNLTTMLGMTKVSEKISTAVDRRLKTNAFPSSFTKVKKDGSSKTYGMVCYNFDGELQSDIKSVRTYQEVKDGIPSSPKSEKPTAMQW